MRNVISLSAYFIKDREDKKMSISSFHKDSYSYDENDTDDNKDYQDETDMATQLFWKPICDNDHPLDKQLKWILKEEDMTENPLTLKDIGFLKGLKAAGVKDADRLIEAIEKYGYITLFEV